MKIYMVIGCPGSGKTWVCEQLKNKFNWVQHDEYMENNNYVRAIVHESESTTKPLLIEAPFSISQIKEPLEAKGFDITPVFIQEHPQIIKARYFERDKKEIPKGHLTRQETYASRAKEWNAFSGTSAQVLAHLSDI